MAKQSPLHRYNDGSKATPYNAVRDFTGTMFTSPAQVQQNRAGRRALAAALRKLQKKEGAHHARH